VTAGIIQGLTILGGIISGPTISGATITGGTIQTHNPGIYPRIELSEANNWLNFEASPSRYFRIQPFSGVFSMNLVYDGSTFTISKAAGYTTIQANDNLFINNSDCAIQMIGNAIQISASGGVFVNGRPI